MCSNFEPASTEQIAQLLMQLSDTQNKQPELDLPSYKPHVWPKDFCPIIIPSDSGLQVINGQFGLNPFWASHPVDYATYNARLETIENKKTFAPAFEKNKFCLVPMTAFYEPYYVKGKNTWQKIYRRTGEPFVIAGMFEYNDHFDEPIYSFTLLTHNADDEGFMSQFHKPNKEKRSISLVDIADSEAYLNASHDKITEFMQIIDGRVFENAPAKLDDKTT